MKLLVLGGTKFLGRALVDAARAAGHAVTLFNRGRTDPAAFPDVEQVRGDRTRGAGDGGFAPLAGRRFDAVIDTAAYVPAHARAAAAFFAQRCDRHVFVSSISVVQDHATPGADESAAVRHPTPQQQAEIDGLDVEGPLSAARLGELYGPMKVLCEEAVEAELPRRALIVRPGLIVGPHDPTDRFTYWPARFARGGTALAPGRPGRVVQFVDVRDLAEWIVRLVAARTTGTFLATGPARPLPFGDLLAGCARVAATRGAPPSTIRWVDEEWLVAQEVAPWMGLPLWIPESNTEMAGFMQVDCAKAIAAGLVFRPLEETIEATLAWDATRPPDAPRGAGLPASREAELLRDAPA